MDVVWRSVPSIRLWAFVVALTAASLLWAGCSDDVPVVTNTHDVASDTTQEQGSASGQAERRARLWEREDEPPAELAGAPATKLLYFPYVNSLKYGNLCGEDVSETYGEGEIIAHGLTADSELPNELVEFLDHGEGFKLLDYEYRWFEPERIVLFTRTRHGPDHSVVAAVVEIALLDGDPPGWGVLSAGGRYICME